MLNRASIFVNFVNHFPLQIAPYFTALTVFTVTQGEAEQINVPPSPAHELCKLISQQQLDKAVHYFESLYLCFCGRVGNSVNAPIETLLLSTINYFESLSVFVSLSAKSSFTFHLRALPLTPG